jgi:exonuclease III
MTDQLSSGDFPSYTASICTALFMAPAPLTSQMTEPNWLQLFYHTASDRGAVLPTLLELLLIASAGNYAILKDHHYWLYPILQEEDDQCLLAFTELAGRIWEVYEGIQHTQLLTAPTHYSLWVDEHVQLATTANSTAVSVPACQSPEPATSQADPPTSKASLSAPHLAQDPCLDTSIHDITGDSSTSEGILEHQPPLVEDTERKGMDRSPTEDPSGVFTLQDQLFQSTLPDPELVADYKLDANIRIATLNINGLSQQKLPAILTYIKMKKIDVLALQDTRLDDKDSQMIALLIRKHFNNVNIQTRIAPVPTAITRAQRVGGQLIIICGKWASRTSKFTKDFTNMGLLTGTTLQANNHKLLILSSYWPIKPTEQCDNSQLWNKVQKYLREHDDHHNPIEFLKRTIQERMKTHIKDSRDNIVILLGDLNSTWGTTATGGCHKGTEQWASSISLRNPLHSLSIQLNTQIFTHWMAMHRGSGAEHVGVSWIDHVLFHTNGSPHLSRGGYEDHNDWTTISDHRPLWVDIHLPLGGTTAPLILPYDLLPLPCIDRTNSKQVEYYQRLVNNKVQLLPATLRPDEVIEAISTISVQACTRASSRPKTFYNSSKFKDGWSPILVAKLAALTAIITMRQHITGAHRRSLWWKVDDIEVGIRRVTIEWEQKIKQLQFDTKELHEEAQLMGRGPTFWRLVEHKQYPLLANWLRIEEINIKKKMHGRQRSLDRQQMLNASAEREKAVKAGKIGKAIKAIMGKSQAQYDLHSLTLPNGELILDPITIHDTHVQHWTEWLNGSQVKTFFDDHIIDWTNPQQHWPQFRDHPAHVAIPADLVLRIWNAIIMPKESSDAARQEISEALLQPITIEELRQSIRLAPSNSVPGPSGLSYNMMKEWPLAVLEKAHAAVAQIWEDKIVPSCWNVKWLCPKPKVQPDLATLQDLRPLNLLETPRKLLMGIVVHRITAIWENRGLLSNSQYGFRAQRSCEGPTLQVLNAQEEAEESGTELHGSSWDIRRAFDSVPKAVLVMSWERLGVPSDVANYIIDLDRHCLSIPLTPHAQHIRQTVGLQAFSTNDTTTATAQGFLGVTGTAQGDTPSPSNWTASFDIPLRALELAQTYPFMVRTDITVDYSQDLAFADDVYSLAARREGLQDKADVMSAAAAILGISFATTKLRTTAKSWGQEPSGYHNTDYSLEVHDRTWTQQDIPVTYAIEDNGDQSFRYLGVQMDINNTSSKQFQILKDHITEVSSTALHRLASPDTITMAIKLSLHRKVSFPGKFSPWSLSELRQLDTPLNALYKHHLRFLQSAPNAALHMSRDVGGLGITRLSDQINIDKWAMLVRGLYSDKATITATLGILNRSLRIGRTDTDRGYQALARPTNIPQHLRSLIELMDEMGYSLRRSGLETAGTPSQLIRDSLANINQATSNNLMHLRITTLADIMIFRQDGNSWNQHLLDQLPGISEEQLPTCPGGNRILRIGQYWASDRFDGQTGRIVEVMGVMGRTINGRSWAPAIPSNTWASHMTHRRKLTWVTPIVNSDSRGAGATETFDLDEFFSGQLRIYTLSKEVPCFRVENNKEINCVARAIRSSHEEGPPCVTACASIAQNEYLLEWDRIMDDYPREDIEIYTDGSVRYFNSISTRVLTPPTSLRQPVFVQGGIFIHAGLHTPLTATEHNITITIEQGAGVELLLPSSVELYSILLAIRLLNRTKIGGTIYTDFKEAIRMRSGTDLRNWGRKANLPIYETIVELLKLSPGIELKHVKAHGDITKQSQWTREQWGNYYADRLAKGVDDELSVRHIRWPASELEQLTMSHSKWHWVSTDNHLLLEPIQKLIQHNVLVNYLIDRDIYRVRRGSEEKWQQAFLGFIEDIWKTKRLRMGKLATINRLIWDRGWHGGNRAKATAPEEVAEAEWVSCGDCGAPDSQHHWIRECKAEHIRTVRRETKTKIREQLEDIQVGKGKKSVRSDIFNACSELVDLAYAGDGGEQIWVGILPEQALQSLEARLSPTECANMTIPNKWRTCTLKILSTLAEGAQKMWQAKEAARTDRLRGTFLNAMIKRRELRRLSRSQDIRVIYRRIALQQSKQMGRPSSSVDIDNTSADLLLQDNNTEPINATKRLRKLTTHRASCTGRTQEQKWKLSSEQEWFNMPRVLSNQMLTRITGKGHEYRRNIRTRNWNTIFGMDWLTEYDKQAKEDECVEGQLTQEEDSMTLDRAEAVEIVIPSFRNLDSNNDFPCIFDEHRREPDKTVNVREGIG